MITLYFSNVSLAKSFSLFYSILPIQQEVCLQISEETMDTNFYNKDVIRVAFQLSSCWTSLIWGISESLLGHVLKKKAGLQVNRYFGLLLSFVGTEIW